MKNPIHTPGGLVRAEPFGTTADGAQVTLFRIPNSTEDYIELLNYGCTVKSLFLHNWADQAYRNQLQGFSSLGEYEADTAAAGAFLGMPGGDVPPALFSRKVWEVQEVGTNYVVFSCCAEAGEEGLASGLTVRTKVQWVNRNRLVVDLYATPDRAMPLNFGLNLLFGPVGAPGGAALRSFAPLVAPRQEDRFTAPALPVEGTPYANQAFVPVCSTANVLLVGQAGEIHPMAELILAETGVSISAYTTANALWAAAQPGGAIALSPLSACLDGPITPTPAGACWHSRAIYGFDPIASPEPERREEPPIGGPVMFCV